MLCTEQNKVESWSFPRCPNSAGSTMQVCHLLIPPHTKNPLPKHNNVLIWTSQQKTLQHEIIWIWNVWKHKTWQTKSTEWTVGADESWVGSYLYLVPTSTMTKEDTNWSPPYTLSQGIPASIFTFLFFHLHDQNATTYCNKFL